MSNHADIPKEHSQAGAVGSLGLGDGHGNMLSQALPPAVKLAHET